MTPPLKFWQVDSFTNQPFKGNPAAVFVLNRNISDELMQNIAIEMNLSETAFILLQEGKKPLLRWFTAMFEIDLCGHATLAATHIYMTEIFPNLKSVTFDTKFVGELTIKKTGDTYCMDFPSRLGEKKEIDDIPDYALAALSPHRPIEAYQARDLMLVYNDENIVMNMDPDFNALMKFKNFISVTALSNNPRYDFISRFFCADDAIAEDPVTGSAHCTLAPYWSKKLNKTAMKAYQASKRGGELQLELINDRVLISGQAITVINGDMNVFSN